MTQGLFKLLLLVVIVFPAYSMAQVERITFGANESPPYWSSTHSHGGLGGEILSAISEAAGIESVIEFSPLIRLIDDVDNNDLGNPLFYMQHQDYSVIIPIVIYYDALFFYQARSKSINSISSLRDLAGYRVGALKGTVSGKAQFQQLGITLEESYSRESLFKKLKLHRLDACIEIYLVGMEAINKTLPGDEENFTTVLLPNSAQPLAIMLDAELPNADELGRKLRAGLQHIIEEGAYQGILDKYYDKEGVPANWRQELDKYLMMYNYEVGE